MNNGADAEKSEKFHALLFAVKIYFFQFSERLSVGFVFGFLKFVTMLCSRLNIFV